MFPFYALLRIWVVMIVKFQLYVSLFKFPRGSNWTDMCRYFDFHNIKAANKASRSLGSEEARVFHTFWIFLFVRERRPRAIRLELASDSDAQRGLILAPFVILHVVNV